MKVEFRDRDATGKVIETWSDAKTAQEGVPTEGLVVNIGQPKASYKVLEKVRDDERNKITCIVDQA
jgi:hypothetical protein